MARKLLNIRHQLRLLALRSSSTNSSSKSDCLTCDFALERSKYELIQGGGIKDVEPSPIDLAAWGRQGMEGVPEQGGGVCGVAFNNQNLMKIAGSLATYQTYHPPASSFAIERCAIYPISLTLKQRLRLLEHLLVRLCFAHIGGKVRGVGVDLSHPLELYRLCRHTEALCHTIVKIGYEKPDRRLLGVRSE